MAWVAMTRTPSDKVLLGLNWNHGTEKPSGGNDVPSLAGLTGGERGFRIAEMSSMVHGYFYTSALGNLHEVGGESVTPSYKVRYVGRSLQA